jgi:predicted dehydrogenase
MSKVILQTDLHPVDLALVGANFGAKIARGLSPQAAHVRLQGVCDLDLPRARKLGAELAVPVYDSLEEVLRDPSVEAVGLFTSPTGRGDLLVKILEAGKHVMTTKPFELDEAAARRAFAAARLNGLALHLNSPSPIPGRDLAAMQTWLRRGDLGRIVSFQARTWADYREVADGSWMDDPRRCPAAPLFRLGVYFLNDFAALVGEAKEVAVQQSRVRTGRPTVDNAQISIRFQNGALGHIFASFCIGDGLPYRDEVTLLGEHGRIERWVERTGRIDMSGDHAVAELRLRDRPAQRVTTLPGEFAGWYNWQAFQAAIRQEPGSVLQAPEPVLYGVRLLAAIARSAAEGRPVTLREAPIEPAE